MRDSGRLCRRFAEAAATLACYDTLAEAALPANAAEETFTSWKALFAKIGLAGDGDELAL